MSDTRLVSQSWGFHNFNPRSPRGGATYLAAACNPCALISIHAPHEGERHPREWRFCGGEHFNPRSPRGGATKLPTHHHHKAVFQSTLPTRGSDRRDPSRRGAKKYFNPRSPRGGATCAVRIMVPHILISIHAPHEGERLSPDPPNIRRT